MEFKFTLSEAEVIEAMKIHGWGTKKTKIILLVSFIALLGLGFMSDDKVFGFSAAVGGLGGYLLALFWVIPSKAKKQYKQNRGLRNEMAIALSETGIEVVLELGNNKFLWSDIHRWVHSKGIYLLYNTSNTFYIIPSRAVTDEVAFTQLLEQHLGARTQ